MKLSKTFLGLCLFSLLFMAARAPAAEDFWEIWTDDSMDHLWSNWMNWDLLVEPNDDTVFVRIERVASPKTGPVIQDGIMDANCAALTIGCWGDELVPSTISAELTMTGGALKVRDWCAVGERWQGSSQDAPGLMTVTGGDILSDGRVSVSPGPGSWGLLTLDDPNNDGGPNLIVDNVLAIGGGMENSHGEIRLYGGTIRCDEVQIMIHYTSFGLLDVTKGRLILPDAGTGEVADILEGFVVSGFAKSYGGRGSLEIDQRPMDSNCTLTATEPNYALAWNAQPSYIDGAYRYVTLGPKTLESHYFYPEQEAHIDANLTWSPGDYASSHDVYLSTSFEDVNNATDPCSYPGRGNIFTTSFDPDLDFGQTYYWRIDEVNDTNSTVWRGNVWSFTVAEYLTIDDFEVYADTNDMKLSWDDCNSGAELTLLQSGLYVPTIDFQAMKYIYDSNDSNAVLTLDSPQDWTRDGVKGLVIYFYGSETNGDSKQMKVAIEDAGQNISTLTYIGDLNIPEWQLWNIVIEDFNDDTIDLMQIQKVTISFTGAGTGEVYFDDISISPSRCFPELVRGDCTGDCTADYNDLQVMAGDWLEQDSTVYAQAPVSTPNQLIAWYEMNTNSGTVAVDSSGNGRNGTIHNGVATVWAPGYTGSALEFMGIEFNAGNVECGTFDITGSGTPGQMSVTYWVNWNGANDRFQSFVGKRFEWEQSNWVWHVGMAPSADLVFFWTGDGNDVELGPPPPPGEWVHVAITTDGTTLRMYYDGVLMTEGPYALGSGTADTAVRIGSTNEFDGLYAVMDDVRFYGYALSQAEVVHVMGESELYEPVESPANIYDYEAPNYRSVNLFDFAYLAEDWLELLLWP